MNTIKQIGDWFKVAVPNPDDKARNVQMGVHLEEVAEMIASIDLRLDGFGVTFEAKGDAQESTVYVKPGNWHTAREIAVHDSIVNLSQSLKSGFALSRPSDRKEFSDSLCDQIITAIGLAHMHGIDIVGALGEVSRSNWSKFEDGKPVFDENGKIKKGRDYIKPDLSRFV